MRTVEVLLDKGLQIGDTVETLAVLRELTAGDAIEATEESERLFQAADGPCLVASPCMVGMNTLRRQIVSIGGHQGPLTIGELKRLSSTDLSLLQEKALTLERATLKEVFDRGRLAAGAEETD